MKRNKNRSVINEVILYLLLLVLCSYGLGGHVYAKMNEPYVEIHNTDYAEEFYSVEDSYTENSIMPYVTVSSSGGVISCEVQNIEIEETPIPVTKESCNFYSDMEEKPDKSKKIFKSEKLSAELQWYAKKLCEKNDIPLEIFMALMYRESTYRPSLVSYDGHDYGLCQIRDENHDWIEDEIGVTNFLDAKQNMKASIFMIKDAMDYYDGTWHQILMVYNGGPAYAKRCFEKGIYSSEYSRAILAKARELGYKD